MNNAGTVSSTSSKITTHGAVEGVTTPVPAVTRPATQDDVGQTDNAGNTITAAGQTYVVTPAYTGDYAEKYTSSTSYNTNKIGGKVAGSLGMTLPSFGIVTPKFEFADEISGYYTGNVNNSSSKTIKTTYTTKTTTETSTSTNYGADFNLANVATPAMKFTFDAGENVKIAAKVKVPVTFDYTRNGADFSATRTVTTTEALDRSTKTVNNVYAESAVNGNDLNQYTVEVIPEVDLGIVWAIMPGKLNFNFGVAATAGDFKWVTKNTTASKKTLNNKTVDTDEFGVETVTADSKSLLAAVDPNGNNTDTSECVYSVTSANVKGSLGATLFLGEYATLDMLIANTVDNYGLENFFQNWNFDIMFSVKF